MKHELYQRRQQTLALKHRHKLSQKHVEKLARKFHVQPDTIWVDWGRRDKWIPQMAQIKQGHTQMLMMFNEFDSTRAMAWKICDAAMKTENYAAAVGALKVVLDVDVKAANLRQSLGVMERVPVKYEVEQIQTIRQAVIVLVEMIEKEDPNLLPKLLKVVENVEDLEKTDKDFFEKAR